MNKISDLALDLGQFKLDSELEMGGDSELMELLDFEVGNAPFYPVAC